MVTTRPVMAGATAAGTPRRRRRVVLAVAVALVLLTAIVLAYTAGRGAGSGYGAGSAAVSSDGVAGPAGGPSPDSSARSAEGAVPASPSESAAGAVAQPGTPPDTAGVPVGDVTRQLVRTAQVTLDVDDPTAVARKVRTAVAGVGGTVSEEESTDGGSRLTLRVPVDRLDAVIDDVAAFGHVTSRSSQTVDATEDVVDLDARVASQRASVDRVRALLSQAKTIGDVVSIESELTRREADLDSLTNRLTALRGQVALSTLTVDVEKGAPVVAPDGPAGFLSGLASGWDGLRALGTTAGAVVGFVLPFLPVLAVLAGLAWAGRRLVRGRRARVTASE